MTEHYFLLFELCSKPSHRVNGSVAVRNRYTGRFTAASIWESLSLIVLLARDPRRTSTHQLAEREDCIKGEQKILLTN